MLVKRVGADSESANKQYVHCLGSAASAAASATHHPFVDHETLVVPPGPGRSVELSFACRQPSHASRNCFRFRLLVVVVVVPGRRLEFN